MSEGKFAKRITDYVNAIFPNRVWFQTQHGWASREPTTEDHNRRRRWVKDYLLRHLTAEDKEDAQDNHDVS